MILHRKIIYLLFVVLLIASCKKPSSTKSEEDQVFIPENLPAYFDSLLTTGDYYIPYHSDSTEEITPIIRSLTLLQDYADGKTDKYPAWAVKQSLHTMAWAIAYAESHAPLDLTTDSLKDSFFEIYMEHAVRLCPDVRLLTDNVSADRQIGILTFDGWSPHPLLCYLIYKTQEGYFRKNCWAVSSTYDKIYQVEHDGRLYYLLINLKDIWQNGFSLVSLSENAPKECLQPVSDEILHLMHDVWLSNDEQLIFNPKECTWKECRKNKNSYWAEFPGSKTFRLKFESMICISLE